MENLTLACKQEALLKKNKQTKKQKNQPQDKDTSLSNRTGYTGMGQTVIEIKYRLQKVSKGSLRILQLTFRNILRGKKHCPNNYFPHKTYYTVSQD